MVPYIYSDFRVLVTELLTVPEEKYVLVNFLRTEVHQEGGGHFSPLVALDPVEDMVLIAGTKREKEKIQDMMCAVWTDVI